MLHPLHGRDELRGLLERAAEVDVDVRRRRTMHPGDLHVAAERNRTDPVLDALPAKLDERRREPDIEAARTHIHEACRAEMPELVDEDEQGEPEDGDEERHVTSSRRASRLASASASTRSAMSRAGAPSTDASVSSTTSAMPRNGSCRSRHAATATSFAALYAHGYVPPLSPARRARASMGNVSRSGAPNSSVSPAARSSAGIGVAARSG